MFRFDIDRSRIPLFLRDFLSGNVRDFLSFESLSLGESSLLNALLKARPWYQERISFADLLRPRDSGDLFSFLRMRSEVISVEPES